MGGLGNMFSIAKERESADPMALLEAVWNEAWQVITKNVRFNGVGGNARAYVFDSSLGAVSDGHWWATENALHYAFSDSGGTSTFMYVALHWLGVSLAAVGKERLSEVAAAHGFSWRQELPTLAAALERTSLPIVPLGQRLATVRAGERNWPGFIEELDVVLSTDGATPSYAELSSEQRKRVGEARRDGVCFCPLCQGLRAKLRRPPTRASLKREAKKAAGKKKTSGKTSTKKKTPGKTSRKKSSKS